MRSIITTFTLVTTLLTLRVEAAEVRIQGIPKLEQTKWLKKLSPRLVFIKSRPATSWRADDAAFYLKRLLIRSGYPDSEVNWQLAGNHTILLKVNRGNKFTFGSVSSNHLTAITPKQLDDYFFQPLIDAEEVPRSHAPYLVYYPEKGASNVQNFLKSQGYWQATVSIASLDKQAATSHINIRLAIDTGKLHFLTTPSIKGISKTQQAALQQRVSSLVDKPATTENISKMNLIVNDYFRSHGFQFASITTTDHHLQQLTKLHFNISPGKRFTVRNIAVRGHQKTKARRFKRYLDHIQGEHYDESHIAKVTNQLLSTGAFQQVIIEPIKVSDNQLDLQVTVRETKARSFRSYAGAQSYEGFIFGIAYADHNFSGKLRRLNIRGEITNRKLLGEVSITEPFFAGEPLRFTLRAYALQRKFDGYDTNKNGIEASLTWEPKPYISTRLYGGLNYVSSQSVSLTNAELGPSDYLNTHIGLELNLDYRDNKVLPRKGFHAQSILEFGSISGDASTSYTKAQLSTSYRYPLSQRSHLTIRANSGAVIAADPNDLPIDLRYFSGGPDSVRSFRQRELGPQSASSDPLGGEAYWNSSIEYNYALNEIFSTTVFYDLGQVYRQLGEFSLSNPSQALGVGLKLDLPIGPVRLEYGYNLNRHPGEPSGALHFSIGAKF